MKLSMWMIANRLSDFTMDLNIREKAPVTLRSARRAYSTDCVHVYQDGDSVLCAGEGDVIRLYNISLAEGLEIIQGIFDFYEDWMEALEKKIQERDFEEIANLCWQVFHNPFTIMDANNHVLGLSRQYAPDSLDAEWAYLSRYGYTSINAVRQLEKISPTGFLQKGGIQRFSPSKGKTLSYGGVFVNLFSGQEYCGRLTVLEVDRQLNRGDSQLLRCVAALLEPIVGTETPAAGNQHGNVFQLLLAEQPYDPTALDYRLQYRQWDRQGTFSLALLELPEQKDTPVQCRDLEMLRKTIASHVSGVEVLSYSGGLILLSNRHLAGDGTFCTLLRSLCIGNPLKVCFSLPCTGIEEIPSLYRQAYYAMAAGKEDRPGESFYDCFDYAVEFILQTGNRKDAYHACMSAVVEMWENRSEGNDPFQTLKVYLDNERSVSKTAEALFTHRNTIIYRLKKIEEMLGYSLDDLYIREYCRLSIRILELSNRRPCRPPRMAFQQDEG